MRFVGLLVVLAIIYAVYTRWNSIGSRSYDAISESESVVAKEPIANRSSATNPANGSTPTASTSGIRRPIDRTKAVLEQVKQRNAAE
jgi:hypothetical protein